MHAWIRTVWVVGFMCGASAPAGASGPPPLPVPNLKLATNGVVFAIATQPDGGVVIGGEFTSVNGVARSNLARLQPDGTLDPAWDPSANGRVTVLVSDEAGTIYAGGQFSSVSGQPHGFLAKLAGNGSGSAFPEWQPGPYYHVDAMAIDHSGHLYVAGQSSNDTGFYSRLARFSTTGAGAVDADWNPAPDNYVLSLAIDDSGAIYAGGVFSNIGGMPRHSIAKLSGSGVGAADPDWNPVSVSGYVYSLALDGLGNLYAGGSFTVGSGPQNGLAKMSTGGAGVLDPTFAPNVSGTVYSMALDASGHLYVGGSVDHIDTVARANLARLSATSGTVDPAWNPSPDKDVYAIAFSGSGDLQVGGWFIDIAGQQRLGFATIDPAGMLGPAVDAENARVFESYVGVYAIAAQPDGGTIVGGHFLKAEGFARRNILRLRADGSLDPDWNPSADKQINAIAVGGDGSVFAGGEFTAIGGQSRSHLAKLAGSGVGLVDANWNPGAGNSVDLLAVDTEGALYVAGFGLGTIGGQSRGFLARLSSTGAGDADAVWNPAPDGPIWDLVVEAGGGVYASGIFTHIGGQARNGLAKLSTTGTGNADLDWAPEPDAIVRSLALSGSDALYVGGDFSMIGGLARTYFAKLSTEGVGAADPVWDVVPDQPPTQLLVDATGDIYAAGGFAAVGNQPHQYLARISGTGAVDADWNPSPDSPPAALASNSTGMLFVGGEFGAIGGRTRAGFAAFRRDTVFADGFE